MNKVTHRLKIAAVLLRSFIIALAVVLLMIEFLWYCYDAGIPM